MAFRVLIVDDQPLVRSILRHSVQTHDGLIVCDDEAETGLQAISLVASLSPDAVILDFEMPEMDGLEALPAIRTALPEGVIVMYSANRSPAMTAAALETGADAYVGKGERTPAQVVALVAEILASRTTS